MLRSCLEDPGGVDEAPSPSRDSGGPSVGNCKRQRRRRKPRSSDRSRRGADAGSEPLPPSIPTAPEQTDAGAGGDSGSTIKASLEDGSAEAEEAQPEKHLH